MIASVCIISLSNIASDARVLRQVEFLSKKYRVTLIGYGEEPKQTRAIHNITWKPIPLPKNKKIATARKVFSRLVQIPILPRTHPAYKLALASGCDVYHANNWDALPIAAQVAIERNTRLVLDLHESFDSWYWGLGTPVVKSVLHRYAGRVNASSTVVSSLAEQHREFGLTPTVIRNIPTLPTREISPKKTNEKRIRLIHHGIASHTRNTDLMIRTLAKTDLKYELHLAFTNYRSKYVRSLKDLAQKLVPGRVFFYPPFPAFEIVEGISEYDVGFYPLPPYSYNQKIALPNKLFEFIAAGLAVCIGPSVSMAEIVDQYHCGIVAPSFEPDSLAEVLNQTTAQQWDAMKQASLKASKELNADVEMQKLITLYEGLSG